MSVQIRGAKCRGFDLDQIREAADCGLAVAVGQRAGVAARVLGAISLGWIANLAALHCYLWPARRGRAHSGLKRAAQGNVHVLDADGQAEIDQRRHPMLRDSAGNNPLKMAQVWFDVDRNAMKTHPFAQANADGRDLILSHRAINRAGPFGSRNPNTNAARADFTGDVELLERGNDPMFQLLHK